MTVAANVSLTGFRYWYPNAREPALDGIDLDFDDGLALLAGASGSGKSSLLRVFNGLVPHFHGGMVSGSAKVLRPRRGHHHDARARRAVGFVFQDPELQSVYAGVDRDVAFGLENVGVAATEMPRRVAEALERTGISHLRGRAVATLSGGERQRLALAGALAMRPRLLVLDEPLAQLDDAGARALLRPWEAGECRDRPGRRRAPIRASRAGCRAGVSRSTADALSTRVTFALVRIRRRAPHRGTRGPRRAVRARGVSADVATGPAGAPLLEGVSLGTGRRGDRPGRPQRRRQDHAAAHHRRAALADIGLGRARAGPGRLLPQNPMALLHRPTVAAEVAWTFRAGPPETQRLIADSESPSRGPRPARSQQRRAAARRDCRGARGCSAIALLDEPTRGMDGAAREALCRVVAHNARRGQRHRHCYP